MANLTCLKCKKTMDEDNFYTYKDGRKTEYCKKCLTMHIDNFDPQTFLWILEKMDVPYIPGEWNTLRDKAYAKDPLKMNGMSVFGKYLSKMKLKQWSGKGWADTEAIAQEMQAKLDAVEKMQQENEEELKRQFEAGEITEAQYKTLMSTDTQYKEMTTNPDFAVTGLKRDNPYIESNFMDQSELPDITSELTQEDKVYLAMKWGIEYPPQDWIRLEQKYEEMMNSFDIQDSDTIGTLILICKTYLKMNQAIDQSDMDTFQKLSRVYESLRKSAKFTAAQKKEQNSDAVDCIGQLVIMCEKEGFIPRFATDIPQDKVDAVLQDNNNYVRKLVTQDLGFGQQIEDALKKIQIQKEMNDAEIKNLEEGTYNELEDEDFIEMYKDIEEQKAQDAETLKGER